MAFSTATIQLFLNTAGAKDALSGFQRKFDSTIANIGKVALGLLGVRGLGGIYNQMQQIVQLSERWQLPVEKVSQFANAFSLFGGNAEGAVQTIEKFQQLANNLKFHSSGALRDLSAIIGVNLNNKDYLGVINAIRSQFGNLNRDAQVEVLDMLGMDDIALQRMLKASDAEFNQAMTEASEMGVVTDDLAKSLRDIEIGWARLKASLIAAFAPMLESLKPVLNGLNRLLTWFNRLSPKTKQWVATILTAVVAIKSLGAALKLLNLGGMIGGAIGLAANPLAWIAAAAAGAVLLATNWDKVTAAFDKWGQKYPEWAGFFEGLKYFLEGIGVACKLIFDVVSGIVDFFTNRGRNLPGMADLQEMAKYQAEGARVWFDEDGNMNIDYPEGHPKNPNTKRKAAQANDFLMRNNLIAPAESVRAAGAYNASRIDNSVDNGVRAGTINIYGVDGADDMMTRLSNLPRNNMTPIKGY